MPSFDVVIGHYTVIPNPFWGGVAFPLFVLGVLLSFPWIERRLTRDRASHNLLDRPRDSPVRTAFGVAFLSFIFLVFTFGASDRLYVLYGVSYETLLNAFRIAIWVVPAVLFVVVRRVCRQLQEADQIARRQAAAAELAAHAEAELRGRREPVL